ncbi:MAG: DUF805 domain-containing protein [Leptotrichiaceae bacterium]|nr:DUF805 domain-containing protein [Leptotrichiaceae bacterium]
MNYFTEGFKKYATFSGRATRSEYWYFSLIAIIIVIVLAVIDGILGTYNEDTEIGLISGIFSLVIFIPSLAIMVRRLHDTNRSGWWYFIILIPIIGAIALLVFLCIDSKEDNKYGANPKANNGILKNDSISQLEKLSELKDKGILTQEEFDAKKKEILG